jgi:uncharacterized membrane protein (DUF373 family)
MFSKSGKSERLSRFENVIVGVLQLIIMLSVAVATLILCVVFVQNIYVRIHEIDTVSELLPAMQRVFAGVLVVLLGLELSETMRSYFADHHLKVELILVIAIVAVGRHMIQLDFDHVAASEIISLAALVLSLTSGYFFVKRAPARTHGPITGFAKTDADELRQSNGI